MPTYVYECSACQTVFEADQRISEDPLTACECGKEGTVKRIIQPTAVMFKGGGFYVNDTSSKPAPVDCTGDKGSCGCSTPAAPSSPPASE